MNKLINVARYHLVDRLQYVLLPTAVTLFAFGVNLTIFALVSEPDNAYTGGLMTLFVYMFVAGLLSVAKSLPFGLTLGVSRRTYFLGTITLIIGVAAPYALGIVFMQALERATGGWGMRLHFFRVPWILDGPWYTTWLTSFVLMVLVFLYGTWFGLVYRRWSVVGTVAFSAGQVLVLLGAAVLLTWTEAWPAVGAFFASLTVLGFVGVLALLATVLALGAFNTMRRVTV